MDAFEEIAIGKGYYQKSGKHETAEVTCELVLPTGYAV